MSAFNQRDSVYQFHHWAEVSLDSGSVQDSTSNRYWEICADYDVEGVHYYEAYYTGGPYQVQFTDTIPGVHYNDPLLIEWVCDSGVLNTSQVVIELSRNNGATWSTLDTVAWDSAGSSYTWVATTPVGGTNMFRLSAFDMVDNESSVVSNAFNVCASGDLDCDLFVGSGDNCPNDYNPSQEDADADGVGDSCDNCVHAYNPSQLDWDGDGYPDSCDNCPEFYNVGQGDGDGDNVGNACDNCRWIWNETQSDIDADSVGDSCDNCPLVYNPNQWDTDDDGIGDACDTTCDPPMLAFNIDTIQPGQGCEALLCIRCSTMVNFGGIWTWDFGDGTVPDSGQHPVHEYWSYGIFDVTVTVEDSCGWADSLFSLKVVCDDSLDTDGDTWPDECDNCVFKWNWSQEVEAYNEWQSTFPATAGFVNVFAVQPMFNGQYLIAGRPTNGNGCCFRLWCLDPCGDTVWDQPCQGSSCNQKAAPKFPGDQRSYRGDWPHMESTTDSGFIVASNAWGVISLIRLDRYGMDAWVSVLGDPLDVAYSVNQSPDGGFVVGAVSSMPADGVMIIKIDSLGNHLWTDIIDELWPAGYYYMDLKPTSDGGYIYASERYNVAASDYDVIIAKLDANRSVVWQRTWDAGGDEYATKVIETSDGGFVVGGTKRLPEQRFFLIKFDATGSLLWDRTFTVTDYSFCYDTRPTSDGGFIMVGTGADSIEYNRQFYVVKTDENGLLEWQEMFDGYDGAGYDADFAHTCAETFDGGYIIGGAAPDGSNEIGMVVKMMPPEPPPSCCVGIRGNVDGDPGDAIDISDLVYLADYMFTGGPAPECWSEANVDGLGPDDASGVDISDLTYLTDYMFTGGPPPPPCP